MRNELLAALQHLPSILSSRAISPSQYITEMCAPLEANVTRLDEMNFQGDPVFTLANSPFPCEQQRYLVTVCAANGTTEIDFLAEQQCLCGGAFFDALAGCQACYQVHGIFGDTPDEVVSSLISGGVAAMSSWECSPTPPTQPFLNILSPLNATMTFSKNTTFPPISLGLDKFPSQTEVSNYFTPTRSWTPGEITGSATARLTSFTNSDGVRFTPTTCPGISSPGSTSVPSEQTTGVVSSSTSSTSTGSGSGAREVDMETSGLLLGVAIVMGVLL